MPSVSLLCKWAGETKYNERLTIQDKGKERSLTDYNHGKTRLDLGKLVEFITNQKQSMIMRSKTNLKNTFPPSLLCFLRLTLFSILYFSSVAQGDRARGLWSVHHMLFLHPLPPQGGVLLLL